MVCEEFSETTGKTYGYDCRYTVRGASQVMPVVKNLPTHSGDVRDMGSIPGSGRSPGGWHGNLLRYFCLENSMDKGAWWVTVHRVTKSQTQQKQLRMHAHIQ